MQTWHIHIQGQVQGVGFRPFIFQLAQNMGLKGWVNNTNDGVHIKVNACEHQVKALKTNILDRQPVLARITGIQIEQVQQTFFDNFQIIHSEEKGIKNLLLTPDAALCSDCKTELNSLNDRRAQYPFITCTNCGPRYSIIEQLPFDRPTTTMQPFPMCDTCTREYHNPMDRRYFSQTNSCKACGIRLTLWSSDREKLPLQRHEVIKRVVELWQQQKIVAIKGIGGYILTCDASSREAISQMRARKHRPTKPFALMYPNLSRLSEVVQINKQESHALDYPAASIVLLDIKSDAWHGLALQQIAPGLNQIGAMLPYTPLYELLLKTYQKPIIATSGNLSGAPIVYEEARALDELSEIADYILSNDRAIAIPQDDSVQRFSHFYQQKVILRRSRGLAPSHIDPHLAISGKTILATGAMLKSTFSFFYQSNTYISQYLGNLEDFDTIAAYKKVMEHFFKLFQASPEIILIDKHPDYPSSRIGRQLADQYQIPCIPVQHHLAHFAAVIGENKLMHTTNPVLGIIWDGTGLGDDEQIWGGEFFVYKNKNFERITHLSYFDFILGDKMPREPRVAALSVCWGIDNAKKLLREKFSQTEWQWYSKLLDKGSRLKTSSMGRLFDAVASLLGLKDKQTFEGEAAILLENLAAGYFRQFGLDTITEPYQLQITAAGLSTRLILEELIEDLMNNEPQAFIAAKFHFTLVQAIKKIADNLKIKKIAFSGGVFQNTLLVDLIIHQLDQTFDLFFHQQLSPNDENVSFGQAIYYLMVLEKL